MLKSIKAKPETSVPAPHAQDVKPQVHLYAQALGLSFGLYGSKLRSCAPAPGLDEPWLGFNGPKYECWGAKALTPRVLSTGDLIPSVGLPSHNLDGPRHGRRGPTSMCTGLGLESRVRIEALEIGPRPRCRGLRPGLDGPECWHYYES